MRSNDDSDNNRDYNRDYNGVYLLLSIYGPSDNVFIIIMSPSDNVIS
jgi:hypothetical protein